MRKISAIAAVLFGILTVASSVSAQQATGVGAAKTPASEPIAGTNISLVRPKGFQRAVDFPGFQQRDTYSSIMITQFAAPYAAATAGFTQKMLAARRINLLDKQVHPVGDLAGVLLHVTQNVSGIVFEKWMLAFGDANHTILVTATFPQELQATLSQPLRQAVLSAQWNKAGQPNSLADLRFRINPAPPFRLSSRIGNTLLFTESGDVARQEKTPTFFSAGYSISDLPDVYRNDHKGFCLKTLATLPIVHQTVRSVSPITVNDLSGYELIAEGTDAKTKTPALVYETILYEDRTYVLMVGTAGTGQAAACLPRFRTMARSFRRKQPAAETKN